MLTFTDYLTQLAPLVLYYLKPGPAPASDNSYHC